MTSLELSLTGERPAQSSIQMCGQPQDYWGEIPQDLMRKLLEVAAERGIEPAVDCLISQDYQSLSKYIFDHQRWTGLNLLNLGPGKSALDVGCGSGCLREGLASMGCCVIANDYVSEHLRV